MQFVLALQEVKSQRRQLTALHLVVAFVLCGIGGCSFVLYWFTHTSSKFSAAYMPFAACGFICSVAGIAVFLLTIFARRKMAQPRFHLALRILELLLLAGSAALFAMQHWRVPAALFGILAAIVLLALFLEQLPNESPSVSISDKGIELPGKKLEWQDIDSVLLRFGTLTIEQAGNRILQRSITEPAGFEPEWLETFARQQIEKHREKRLADSW